MTPGRPARPWRAGLGTRARRTGRTAEWIAALFLMSRGYRILGFRLKAAGGEIDLLARRGRVLAVVEVKRRTALDAAMVALKPAQQARLRAAGRAVARGRPGLAGLALRLDVVALAPGRWPRHIRGLDARD